MTIAILVAAGKSERFGENKLFATLLGIPVIARTIGVFAAHPQIDHIFLVIPKNAKKEDFSPFLTSKKSDFITLVWGGETRFESVFQGILEAQKNFPEEAKILVHNGANPGVTAEEISEVIAKIDEKNAVAVGRRITGTLRKKESEKTTIIPRENVWEMEAPQGATLKNLLSWSHKIKNIPEKMQNITDEIALAENFGAPTVILPASMTNRKITTPEDILLLEKLMRPETVLGIGIDSHRFETVGHDPLLFEMRDRTVGHDRLSAETGCIIGGIEIPNTPPFLANSDGDVLLHALCNAFLSAAGKGSFSRIADPLCEAGEKDSAIYLKKVLEELSDDGLFPHKISASLEGKRPKLEKYFPEIRKNLAHLCHIPEENIGLNATTGEDLDGVGRGDGMRATVMVECKTM